jgi:hypothetical protein
MADALSPTMTPARLRKRLLVSRAIEELRRADRYACREEAAIPDFGAAISEVNAATNGVAQIVIRPLKSQEFGSRVGPE